MTKYLSDLLYTVVGAFVASLVTLTAADKAFNVLTFEWGRALTISGSLAFLALLHGVAARFQGDPDRARFTAPQK